MSKYTKDYTYNSRIPLNANIQVMPQQHQDLLTTDPHFCMIPWVHMHAIPDGNAYPCCLSEFDMPIGNLKHQTMKQVWNSSGMKEIRKNMLNNKPSKECGRCYEQERSGFVSMRHTMSQNFGHHISLVDNTLEDGTVEDFKIRYYDIRFSNVCNFRCRTCGGAFSSNWYNDEVKLWGPTGRDRIAYAGRTEEDMWEQMQEHIPHLERIYFAGGEPLIMEEHYRLLNELVKRKMFHVNLVYNSNFSKLAYKDQDVLEIWKHFDSVAVGASLDASYQRGEYMRKGTEWADIVNNRKRMQQICPQVDFYISPTVSIFNAMHVVDFHREWIELGLIRPQDININILQTPDMYRIDILPAEIKDQIRAKVLNHINWLEPQDKLTRATSGFRGLISFMDANQQQQLIPQFLHHTARLDQLRQEDLFAVFPELESLRTHATS